MASTPRRRRSNINDDAVVVGRTPRQSQRISVLQMQRERDEQQLICQKKHSKEVKGEELTCRKQKQQQQQQHQHQQQQHQQQYHHHQQQQQYHQHHQQQQQYQQHHYYQLNQQQQQQQQQQQSSSPHVFAVPALPISSSSSSVSTSTPSAPSTAALLSGRRSASKKKKSVMLSRPTPEFRETSSGSLSPISSPLSSVVGGRRRGGGGTNITGLSGSSPLSSKARMKQPPAPPYKATTPVSRVFHDAPSYRSPMPLGLLGDSPTPMTSPVYGGVGAGTFFDQCFSIVCQLGEGSFGVVYRVRSREDGSEYAVKRSRQCFRSEGDRRQRMREARMVKALPPHPNCLRCVAAWEEAGFLFMQTELCELGNLLDYAHSLVLVDEEELWGFVADIASGLHHIHSQGLLHLDIKPANLFLCGDAQVKIGDFGIAVGGDSEHDDDDATEGDSRYMAPELLCGNFSAAADIFSLGISVLELATHIDLPSRGELWVRLRTEHLPADLLADVVDADLVALIRDMMRADPKSRPTAADVLAHPTVVAIARRGRLRRLFCPSLADCYRPIMRRVRLAAVRIASWWAGSRCTYENGGAISQTDCRYKKIGSQPYVLSEWSDDESSPSLVELNSVALYLEKSSTLTPAPNLKTSNSVASARSEIVTAPRTSSALRSNGGTTTTGRRRSRLVMESSEIMNGGTASPIRSSISPSPSPPPVTGPKNLLDDFKDVADLSN